MYREAPLAELCRRAQAERYRHVPERRVSYQIDRNVNYTNVCLSGCKFCNFHCRPDEPEKAYTLSFEDYLPKIAELKRLGGSMHWARRRLRISRAYRGSATGMCSYVCAPPVLTRCPVPAQRSFATACAASCRPQNLRRSNGLT